MKLLYLILSTGIANIFILKISAQTVDAVEYAWHHDIVGTSPSTRALFIEIDEQGNTYTAGDFTGTVDMDGGPGTSIHTSNGGTDIFITKKGPSGNHIWTRTFGAGNDDIIHDFDMDSPTSPNLYILGQFNGNIIFDIPTSTSYFSATNSKYIVKLTGNNNFLFGNILFKENDISCKKMAVRPNGNILVYGVFANIVDFDPGPTDNFISSTSPNDTYLMELTSGFSVVYLNLWGPLGMNDNAFSIEVSPGGETSLFGNFLGTKDFNPSLIDNFFIAMNNISGSMYHIRLNSSGGFLNGGVFNVSATGTNFKFDNGGRIHLNLTRSTVLTVGATNYPQNFAAATLVNINPVNSTIINVFNINSLLPDRLDGFDFFTDASGNQRIMMWVNCGANTGPYTIYGNLFSISLTYVVGNIKNVDFFYGGEMKISQSDNVYIAGFGDVPADVNPNGTSLFNPSNGFSGVLVKYNYCEIVSQNTLAPVSACHSDTVPLLNSTLSSGPYWWSGPNGFIDSTLNTQLNNVNSSWNGNYVAINYGLECKLQSNTITLTVNPLPLLPSAVNATPGTTLCSGDVLTLNAPAIANTTYQWNGPNGFSSNAQNPGFTTSVASAGLYQLTITNTLTGCVSLQSGFSQLNIAVNALPALPSPVTTADDSVCAGTNVILTAPTINNVVYIWSGPLGFNVVTQSPTLFNTTVPMSGTYSLNLVSTVTGCQMGSSPIGNINLLVSPLPVLPSAVSISPSNSACVGSSVTLNAPTLPGTQYNWTGPAGFFSTLQSPTLSNITLTQTGTYNLQITNLVSGCNNTSNPFNSTNLTVNPLPDPSILTSSSDTVCFGAAITLNASTGANLNYTWTGPNGYSSTGVNAVINNADTVMNGFYFLEATNTSSGCSSLMNDSVNVFVHPPMNVIAAILFPPIICDGQSFSLGGLQAGNNTYLWTGPNGYSSTQAVDTVFNAGVNASGLYTLTVTNVNTGCSISLSDSTATLLTVNPLPPVSFLIADDSLCVGEDFQATANLNTNQVAIWYDGTTYSQTNPFILSNTTLSNNGMYTMYISDSVTTCYDSLNFAVTVQNNPQLMINDSLFLCGGQLAAPAGYDQYTWSNGTTTSATNFNSSGNYFLIVDSLGCKSDTAHFFVSLFDQPLSAIGNNIFCEKDQVTIEGIFPNNPDNTFTWFNPNGGSMSNPMVLFNAGPANTGTYQGILFNSQYQCYDTVEIELSLDSIQNCFLIPQIVTPNGDNQNDNWQLDFLIDVENEVFIFNRWGSTVFYMKNYDQSFNGVSNQGVMLDERELPSSTYYYKIIYENKILTGYLEIQK